VGSPVAGAARASAAAGDRLPDLAMARPLDIQLQIMDGRRRLRFTTMIVNIGDGPFETRASRRSKRHPSMVVKQRIYDTIGGYRVVTTPAVAGYSGDGHDHWHVQQVATYELYAGTGLQPVVDHTRPYRLYLLDAPETRR